MSCTALVTGRLIGDPEVRKARSGAGQRYTMARLEVATEDDSTLATVVAFGDTGDQLAAMAKGDTVAAVGRAKPTAWLGKGDQGPRAGLSMVADQLLTAYHVRRKRQAVRPAGERDLDTGDDA